MATIDKYMADFDEELHRRISAGCHSFVLCTNREMYERAAAKAEPGERVMMADDFGERASGLHDELIGERFGWTI
jgi:hypothetical protein